MNHQGNVGLAIVAVILALTILAVYLVNVAQRECNSNRDCPENAYCSSDYECHTYPDRITVKENNFLPAAMVFGISIIIAAWIFRKKSRGQ